MASPVEGIPKLWLENVKFGADRKEREFNKHARDAARFFDGNHGWIFDHRNKNSSLKTESGQLPPPQLQMTVNRVFELVTIFGPMLYNKNPMCTVKPRIFPEMPMEVWQDEQTAMMAMQMQAQFEMRDKVVCSLMQNYLNYLPNEVGMYQTIRNTINECLIKGLGAVFIEMFKPKGSNINLIRPVWVNVKNIVVDPDAESWGDMKWIAMLCQDDIQSVEEEYGLAPGTLKGNLESTSRAAEMRASGESEGDARRKGKTRDIVRYWKIWSKVGIGRLRRKEGYQAEEHKYLSDKLGPYVFLAIADGVDHPLNLPPEVLDLDLEDEASLQEVLARTSWGVPHWADDAWPIEFLNFHDSPDRLWPISHITPAIGEQFAIDWVYSIALTKLRTAYRTVLGATADIDEEHERQLQSGNDYEVLKLKTGKNIKDILQEFNFGTFNPEIWQVAQMLERNFEMRTGLSPMIYGQQGDRGIRTAAEATGLQGNLNIRPDDMREQVENFMTRIFRRMALTARYMLTSTDVEPVFGKANAMLWDEYVTSVDLDTMVREYEYRIESGSTRKPNMDTLTANYEQASQMVLPMLMQSIQFSPDNVNVLNHFLKELAKVRGMDWPFEIQAPQPPPPPPGMEGGPMPPDGPMPPEGPNQPPNGMPPEGPPPEEIPMEGEPMEGGGLPPELMEQGMGPSEFLPQEQGGGDIAPPNITVNVPQQPAPNVYVTVGGGGKRMVVERDEQGNIIAINQVPTDG